MIPANVSLLTTELETDNGNSLDYGLVLERDRIQGTVEEIEAMPQVIYKILNTERYRHAIYSWNYGLEMDGLYGMPAGYVMAELERRITEALTQDSRITDVSDFEFETPDRQTIRAKFTVKTVYGDVDSERVVGI